MIELVGAVYDPRISLILGKRAVIDRAYSHYEGRRICIS
jgi:hypothetical protein